MVSVMLYYKTLRMASMKIQHIQNAVNQGLKLTYIHCWIASPLKNPISFIVALFPAASSCPYKPSLTDLWLRCNIKGERIMKIAISTIGMLIFFVHVACSAESSPQKQEKSIRELIIHLNNEYRFLDAELKKLEDDIKEFPHTTLSISVIKRDNTVRLISLEIFDGDRPLGKHIYTTLENEAMEAGGRHQVFEAEIKEGNHTLKAVYYWTKTDKSPQKDETIIPVSISLGNSSFLELSFDKKENKIGLSHYQLNFSNK